MNANKEKILTNNHMTDEEHIIFMLKEHYQKITDSEVRTLTAHYIFNLMDYHRICINSEITENEFSEFEKTLEVDLEQLS